MTLKKSSRPALVDREGKTTITSRVRETKYLLFEPEGIRWQSSSFSSALDEPDYPVLLNGIAWWPLPDKSNMEGWRELTTTSRAPLLKTRAFAWAADPNGSQPEIKQVTGDKKYNIVVEVKAPSPEQSGIRFSGPTENPVVVECVISQHQSNP